MAQPHKGIRRDNIYILCSRAPLIFPGLVSDVPPRIYIYMHKRTETAVGGIISPSFLDRLNDDEGA
jgi:hypothetical protein